MLRRRHGLDDREISGVHPALARPKTGLSVLGAALGAIGWIAVPTPSQP